MADRSAEVLHKAASDAVVIAADDSREKKELKRREKNEQKV
jgi:hypothetical protein